jgi:hypothetical protein
MTYHEPCPPRKSARRRCARAVAGTLLLVSLTGCVESRGEVGLIAFDAERVGTKMLRPGAQGRACAARVLGIGTGDTSSPLDRALAHLRALDAEADALTNVTIEVRGLSLGVVDRTCVTVHADVVRQTSLVQLPAPPGHEGHH